MQEKESKSIRKHFLSIVWPCSRRISESKPFVPLTVMLHMYKWFHLYITAVSVLKQPLLSFHKIKSIYVTSFFCFCTFSSDRNCSANYCINAFIMLFVPFMVITPCTVLYSTTSKHFLLQVDNHWESMLAVKWEIRKKANSLSKNIGMQLTKHLLA